MPGLATMDSNVPVDQQRAASASVLGRLKPDRTPGLRKHTTADSCQQPTITAQHPQADVADSMSTQRQPHDIRCHSVHAVSSSSGDGAAVNHLSESLAAMGCMPVPGFEVPCAGTILQQQSHHQRRPHNDVENSAGQSSRCNQSSTDCSPYLTQRNQPFSNLSSSTVSSASGCCSSDDESTASSTGGNHHLLELLQEDCKRQAEHMKHQDQQLHEMKHLQHLLLQQVSVLNETLRHEPQLQHTPAAAAAAPSPLQSMSAAAAALHNPLQPKQQLSWQQQLQYQQQMQCHARQPQTAQQVTTPFCTPRAGISMQSLGWRTAPNPRASGYYYHPVPPSPACNTSSHLAPSPPQEAAGARRPAPRRRRTCSSLQQLSHSAGATPVAAAVVSTDRKTDPGSVGWSSTAGTPLERVCSLNRSGSDSAAVLSLAESSHEVTNVAAAVAASIVNRADVSVSISKRDNKQHMCFVPLKSHCPAAAPAAGKSSKLSSKMSSSSRTVDASVSPRLLFRPRSLQASPAVSQQAAKFHPMPPRDRPHAEGGRTGQLREFAKKGWLMPYNAIHAEASGSPANFLSLYGTPRQTRSSDGSLTAAVLQRGRSRSDCSDIAAFDAAVETHSRV